MVFLQLSNPQHSAELWDVYGGLILRPFFTTEGE